MSNNFQEKRKTFTFVGFSGCGKTTLSQKLSNDGFFHYSIDYEIANLLKNPIKQTVIENISLESKLFQDLHSKFAVKLDLSLNFDDLELVTMFAIPMNQSKKINYKHFTANQDCYKNAEYRATQDFYNKAQIAFKNYQISGFINDTTGSICQVALNDTKLLNLIKENTTVIFFQTDDSHLEILKERAKNKIKPILYDSNFFLKNLQEYYKTNDIDDSFEIDKDFFFDIFPKLIDYRKSCYQEFCQKTNAISIPVDRLSSIANSKDFFNLIS